ncbi:MAG TPA: LLM class F420-dependent oxidoreductase [Candidatus Binatia bacterium]|nr:LLM class F420-dependent oxidoreductase [Candidatus Binatia bacterium]
MDYGIVLPHFGSFAREEAARRIVAAAEAAEALGYSTVWVIDHIVLPAKIEGGYAFNPLDPFLEPLTVLGALALKTSRVKLGTAVLVLPYRHPIYTAKALATVDVLSGGRLVVGVGAGWMEPEFTALGVPIAERGSRTNETIDILKALWTQETPGYAGRHFQFSDIKFIPQPVQKPRPPILVGGMTRGALQRVARRGDGWIALGKGPEDLKAPLDTLRELTAKAGRKLEDLRLSMLPISTPTLDQVIKDVPRYGELGIDHVYLSCRAWTSEFPQLMALMERFAREVGLKG